MARQPSLDKDEAKAAAKALEVLFTTEYVSKKELYKANFLRGIFFSAGSIIGAALILGLGVWILSQFESIPVLKPLVETIKNTLESSSR